VAYFAKKKGMTWAEVVRKLDKVDWSMDNSVWFNILVIPAKKKKVITGKESIRAAGMVISYMVMGEKMTDAEVNEVREIIKNSTNGTSEKLPEMI
jgi:DNA sulfur modification protein DndB